MPKRLRREGFRLPVHTTCRTIRQALGWSRERMATEIGVSSAIWSQYEAGRIDFSLRVLERVRDVTGIDPYVLAYALHYDYSKLPDDVQAKLRELRVIWSEQLEKLRICRQLAPTGHW